MKSGHELGYVNETIQDSMVTNSMRVSSLTLSLDSRFRESIPQVTGTAGSFQQQSTAALYSNQQEDTVEYSNVYETDDWSFKMETPMVDCDKKEDTQKNLEEEDPELPTVNPNLSIPETRPSGLDEANIKCGHGMDEIAIGYVKVTDYDPDATLSERI